MAETFYAALGVDRVADEERIRRAFRERAKTHHPDVSDDPDARAQFKRLTVAKETLLDADERKRYDQLGHATYVHRHVDADVWEVDPTEIDDRPDGKSASAAARAYAAETATDGGRDPPTAPHGGATRAAAASSGAAYYSPGTRVDPSVGGGSGVVDALASLGPWLAVYVVMVCSGLATAWLVTSWMALSVLSVAIAGGVLVATLAVTALHLTMNLSRR